MMSRTIRVGDTVRYTHGGTAVLMGAITGITDAGPLVCAGTGTDGQRVHAIDLDSRMAVVDLDTGHWAYGSQLVGVARDYDDGDGRR